jgi:hypothetical protein
LNGDAGVEEKGGEEVLENAAAYVQLLSGFQPRISLIDRLHSLLTGSAGFVEHLSLT